MVLKLNAYRFTLVQKHPCKLEAIEKALAKRNAGKGLILLDASILPVRLPDIIAYQVLHNVEQGFLHLSLFVSNAYVVTEVEVKVFVLVPVLLVA